MKLADHTPLDYSYTKIWEIKTIQPWLAMVFCSNLESPHEKCKNSLNSIIKNIRVCLKTEENFTEGQ